MKEIMIKRIEVNIIPHKDQRYNTVGDYYFTPDGTLVFNISDCGNDFANELILVHEIVEEMLTRKRGITEPDIMAFDELYEQERADGLHTADDEPGWDERCPYLKEHAFAESVERLCANELSINWLDYDEMINEVWNPQKS